jgi:long-chain acyl-CoA synthetase
MVVDLAACPSLTAMAFAQAERLGDRPLLWARHGGAWQATSWAETAARVRALAGGLLALGLAPGDRVVLAAESRPEWAVADLAIMAAGGISVPAYTTNTVSDHLHILDNSAARFAIVSTRALAERVLAAAVRAGSTAAVIAIEPPPQAQSSGVRVLGWDETLALGAGREAEVEARVATTTRGDTACIIYTSGTGGAPKGVMLSHGAILANCHGAFQLLQRLGTEDEVFLSFLPLSHSYEHTVGLYFPLAIGAQIHYAEGIEQLAANMLEVRPTLMTAVPRLYETLRARTLRAVERQGGFKAHLFHRTLALGARRIERGRLGPLDFLLDRLLDRMVRATVRARFGGRLKALVSGGAPLAPEVGLFFTALGIRILQGYGLTESAPVISCNPPGAVKLATVGPPLDGVRVHIAADGEICVQGELLMQGYWRDREATRQALRPLDGGGEGDVWLHTGDIGDVDSDGYIRITDRKKDIIVNSGGDNISPQRIEGLLTLQPEIAQAMAYGDRRPHLVALLVPAEDWAQDWAHRHGTPYDPALLAADSDFRRALGEAVDRVNRDLSTIEKIRRYAVCPQPFTVDNAMLTPTLKIRRHMIRQTYGRDLEELYE